jgi:DNA adenine methylase
MRSPIKWVGGKSRLSKVIVPLIAEHTCYVEVFGGAGWVLFQKTPSQVEVLNDLDGELMNFFRVVQHKPKALIHSFEWDLASRAEFERLRNADTTTQDDVERAHRFYYLIMASWGGEFGRARFQTSITDFGHGNRLIAALRSVRQRVTAAHERLQTVIIENLDWQTCIEKYDDPRVFLYLDPPYPGNNCNYAYNMRGMTEHEVLFERLKTLRAKWLLSTYDKPDLHEYVRDFYTKKVTFSSGMPGNGRKNQEILVANYPLDVQPG